MARNLDIVPFSNANANLDMNTSSYLWDKKSTLSFLLISLVTA